MSGSKSKIAGAQPPNVGAVRHGWVCLHKGQMPYEMLQRDYFVNNRCTWATKAFQHVFSPDPTVWSFDALHGFYAYSKKEEDELLVSVAQALFRCEPSGSTPSQPEVYFKGRNVHVCGLSNFQLLELSVTPPIVRGKPMKLVEKGLPFNNPFVQKVANTEATPVMQFLTRFSDAYKDRLAKNVNSDGLQAAFASYYEIEGLSHGPIASGEVIMFYSGYDSGSWLPRPFFCDEETWEAKDWQLQHWS